MRDTFRGFYPPNESELETLWRGGAVVLDANVLLNLYKLPEPARNDFFRVLEAVQSRFCITYQAALEYEKRRETVISRQLGVFDSVRQTLGLANVQKTLDTLQLKKSHSVISVDDVLRKIQPILDDFERELVKLEEKHIKPTGRDPIRERLNRVFEARIGAPLTHDEMARLVSEGETRYSQRIPPGYEDDSKSKQPDFAYGGLTIKPKFGDLIIWKEILKYAREAKLKALMMVSDDEKADWRHTVEHRGKRLVLPRPELIDEIRREAGVEVFYIYSSELFLKYAKERLSIEIKESTVPQVTDVKEAARTARSHLGTGVVEVVGEVGNRRDALLSCNSCGANNLPLHFYEGGGTPSLNEVLGLFHYWECPAISEDATVSILMIKRDSTFEIITWRRSR